jgi:hypothetical protein
MFVPLWMLNTFAVIWMLIGALDIDLSVQRLRGRHHDHLLPNTPRSERG